MRNPNPRFITKGSGVEVSISPSLALSPIWMNVSPVVPIRSCHASSRLKLVFITPGYISLIRPLQWEMRTTLDCISDNLCEMFASRPFLQTTFHSFSVGTAQYATDLAWLPACDRILLPLLVCHGPVLFRMKSHD